MSIPRIQVDWPSVGRAVAHASEVGAASTAVACTKAYTVLKSEAMNAVHNIPGHAAVAASFAERQAIRGLANARALKDRAAKITKDDVKRAAQDPQVQRTAAIVTGGVVVGVVMPPLILGAAGFTSGGVAAGSIAAGIQSGIGNVAAGSAFAGLQSMGVLGIPAGIYLVSSQAPLEEL
ncbi:hypothetical protein K438DRAFT_1821289 [Mycena galopus ATCC 62051]|nr:hypothetical protein K438DRAFT_1821289 [Mycena galopus ATCC 62051]